MIDENKPQRQPAACIQPQVTSISIDLNSGTFSGPRPTIRHDL
jgi:hypothetical protein